MIFSESEDKKKLKEAFGYIIKKEQLESRSEGNENQCMVLTASNPFPDYAGKINKNYFYLVLDNLHKISIDDLIRITQKINQSRKVKLDVWPCEITLYNKFYTALRLHHYPSEQITKLIAVYQQFGLHFMKYQEIKAFISQIRVSKYFELIKIDEGLYTGRHQPEFKYIQIPEKLSWDEFESMVDKARHEEAFLNCDFAIAYFHSKQGFDDLIRIFSDSCSTENLKQFQQFILTTYKHHLIK